ncbi:type VI secretion system amidase effector protein Tae4 [Paraburkholderia sp. CNPSo 3076]|uniref:type VI secretion system amidase effector protein Tae4 n=1 Tax=Paraburkholderia sp. CNPSo 3076 TaxID=2940936 RepID=UPI00224D4CC2|nr:type VI secretion system amidase effector protein Tae4 [Paraburkholderia sp. CNPSo 3076]MCX5541828.1 type VI secretion system amidase effector protein Tae4 [Paraburkholderia sp. CNPSo 3076]
MPNKKTQVQTNSKPGSIKEVQLRAISFQELWSAYPDEEDPFRDSKTGEVPPYADNQCAIRLSIALHNVGVEMKSFRGEGQIRIDGKRTALRASEMAHWLNLKPFAGLPTPEDITGSDWQEKIRGRTGIVFFSGYWARKTDKNGQTTGDHIDLWNGKKLTSPGMEGRVNSFMRFTLGVSSAWYADLGKAKKILFWEIK